MKRKSLPLMLSFLVLSLGFSVFQGCGSGSGGGGCLCALGGLAPGTQVTFFYFSGNVLTFTANSSGQVCYPSNDQPQPPTAPPVIDCNVSFRIGSAGAPVVSHPDSVNLNSPPSSLTFTGLWGIDTTYGMPIVDYFNDRGSLFSYQLASAVGGGGSWLTVPLPNLAASYSGTYRLRISNKRWDNGYTEAIDVLVSCWGRDRIDADSDGWSSNEDCDDNDPFVNPGALPDCYGVYYDRNCNGWDDQEECSPGGGGGGCYVNRSINLPIEPFPCY